MSAIAVTLPPCPEDCLSILPVVDISKCAPKTNAAGIQWILFTTLGYSISDHTSAPAWVARLSNSSSNVDAIRQILVKASKPKPESTTIELAGGLKAKGKKKHSIPFIIDQTNATNRELQRISECGLNVTGWYMTSGGLLAGGSSGIDGSLEMDIVIDEDTGQVIRIEGAFTWEAQYTEVMIDSPIAL